MTVGDAHGAPRKALAPAKIGPRLALELDAAGRLHARPLHEPGQPKRPPPVRRLLLCRPHALIRAHGVLECPDLASRCAAKG
jgi:hypothetical protein